MTGCQNICKNKIVYLKFKLDTRFYENSPKTVIMDHLWTPRKKEILDGFFKNLTKNSDGVTNSSSDCQTEDRIFFWRVQYHYRLAD